MSEALQNTYRLYRTLTADRKPVVAIIRIRRAHIGAIETQVVATGRARGRTRPQVAIGTCIVQ